MEYKENCLTRALDAWKDDNSLILLYNSEYVFALPKGVSGLQMASGNTLDYLPVEEFGYLHFVKTFEPPPYYNDLLLKYINKNEVKEKEVSVVIMADTFNMMCNANLITPNPPTFTPEFMAFVETLRILISKNGEQYYKKLP